MEDLIARLTNEAQQHRKIADEAMVAAKQHDLMATSIERAVNELMKARGSMVEIATTSSASKPTVREKVKLYFQNESEPRTAREVADVIDTVPTYVKNIINELVAEGKLEQTNPEVVRGAQFRWIGE